MKKIKENICKNPHCKGEVESVFWSAIAEEGDGRAAQIVRTDSNAIFLGDTYMTCAYKPKDDVVREVAWILHAWYFDKG